MTICVQVTPISVIAWAMIVAGLMVWAVMQHQADRRYNSLLPPLPKEETNRRMRIVLVAMGCVILGTLLLSFSSSSTAPAS